MAVEFDSFRELLMNVFYHLVPAYFRISYSFYLPNVMIDQIKHQYASIYEMTRKALLPLERRIGKSIPEEEIGFSLYYLAERSEKRTQKKEIEK